MQHNLVALGGQYNDPQPIDIARRWMETHMAAGFLPVAFAVPTSAGPSIVVPQALPWMGAFNSVATGAVESPAPAAADIVNPWRAKATAQEAIYPSDPVVDHGDILSWECAFAQSSPVILDSLQITLATDTFYENLFVWGPDCPAGKVNGDPVDDVVLQVLVDSALASSDRVAATMPLLVRSFKATVYDITQPAFQGTPDDMIPVNYDQTVTRGLCIVVTPSQPIPANSRVRLILSVPLYNKGVDAAPLDVSTWGSAPWQTFVLSSHITLLQSVGAA
jgi:hypothetical protein